MSGPPERRIRREAAWAVALLLLALALRAGFVLTQQRGFYFEDSLDYDRAARAFLETGRFDARYYRFPAYPLFLAGSYAAFGDHLTPVRLLQALAGTLTCLFVWRTGRELFGARAGLLALAGAALFPVHVVLAGIEYPVALGMLLIWMVLALFPRRTPEGALPMHALVLAAAATAVASTLFEGGLVLGTFLLLGVMLQDSPRRTRWRQVGFLLALGVFALGPWMIGMVRRGDYRPIILKAAIHLPSAPGVEPPLWQGSGTNLLEVKLRGLADNPGWTVRHAWREFWHFWNPYPDRLASADDSFRQNLHRRDTRMVVQNSLVSDAPRRLYAVGFSLLLTAAGLGALVAWRTVPRSRFLVGWPIFLGLCYAPFFTQMRYRIPADPAFILLGAYAVEMTMQRSLWDGIKGSLTALWEGWKKVALKIAVVQTFILLFIMFYIGMGPIALLMKLFRKDPMHAPTAEGSFWALREKTRENLEECLRQF